MCNSWRNFNFVCGRSEITVSFYFLLHTFPIFGTKHAFLLQSKTEIQDALVDFSYVYKIQSTWLSFYRHSYYWLCYLSKSLFTASAYKLN